MTAEDELPRRILALTRQINATTDRSERIELEHRRARLLRGASLKLRIREDDDSETIVLYPREWVDDDGTVDPATIEDPDAAIEFPLEPTTDEADWDVIDAHNQRVARAVEARYGPVHGATAKVLATYLSNHHLRRMEHATPEELQTFKEDYLVRNGWPDAEQLARVDRTVEVTKELAQQLSVGEDAFLDLE